MEDKILAIIEKVEQKLSVHVGLDDLCEALTLTVRKMEVKKKEPDYFPLLFETELEEVFYRQQINLMGAINRCATFA